MDAFKEEYWTSVWKNTDYSSDDLINDPFVGIRDSIIIHKAKQLFPKGKVLDAGCGMGQYVIFLSQEGYECSGLDYSSDTISKNKLSHPELEWVTGDITKLPFPDSIFEGILSIGVIYYPREGPLTPLREAERVLKDQGYILVTVPFQSYLQRIRKPISALRNLIIKGIKLLLNKSTKSYHYQDEFTLQGFRKIIRQTGFKEIEVFPIGIDIGFHQEINELFRIKSNQNFFGASNGSHWKGLTPAGQKLCSFLNKISKWFTADMVLFVLQKKA